MKTLWSGTCLLVAALALAVRADQVILTNGDRLTGTVQTLQDGALTLASLAGEVSIPVAHIATLSTDRPVQLKLASGPLVPTTLSTAAAGQVTLSSGQTLALADIAAINPPPVVAPKWKGAASLGWSRTHGNTANETYNVSANAAKRRAQDRISMNYEQAKTKASGATTEDWWRVKGKYDYFVSARFYAYGDGRYEVDGIANLDQRIITGAGGGYQWVESDTMNLGSEFGAAMVYEEFFGASSNNEFSAQFSNHFDWQARPTVQVIHDVSYYPALSKLSDYYLTTTAEVRARFTATMFSSVKAIFDYDATPAPGKGNTDVKYIFSVGMTF